MNTTPTTRPPEPAALPPDGQPVLTPREAWPRAAWQLEQAGLPPLLARLFAARGIRQAQELDDGLQHLLPPGALTGATAAARLLADAIEQGTPVCVVADYDCDGATACAVALRGLALLGADPARLHHVVPDRQVHGYGLTPTIVDLVRAQGARLLVTVDNGIASHAGVAHAQACGLQVLITDHHLPAVQADGQAHLPPADVIVNPNQPGCGFPSKALAGVGVMFYVLLALRAERRQRGAYDQVAQPRLDSLLDLVALGTVADVVRLDENNRRLVAQGLRRIREGRMQPGVRALFHAAGRDPARASAQDFGFSLGPRINAAGRLADMGLGIACLLTDDPGQAQDLARQLDAINRERREVEAGMREHAENLLDDLMPRGDIPAALVLYDEDFHEGVVGIVAGRLKDRLHRPTFVFAKGQDGLLKGSGRSIAGFHLRDALDLVAKRQPGLLLRFGGHAMAAGCTLPADGVERFRDTLLDVAQALLAPATLARRVLTDGPLAPEEFSLETARLLEAQVWGQGFEAPLFCDEVDVLQQRLVGGKHLKLKVGLHGQAREGIWFGRTEPLPPRTRLAYRLAQDEFQGQARLQMVVEAAG
ncbi:single-stranded-DNA-specific exonuclease RecJ [Ideonella livida]|uniref:Single-stranded-DNA-specific exonuclease RecJ n=1 Tax=Ideonella livida TaxID=2707176 RepID=A0A7C9TGV8_9BURK|nr:single-stranded-DNA-specific exonuclease RecJ [Ideonella livida]NDY90099.1 single-stranded-DNA-specific exonuclease RecJ [Ideonella livida]